MVNPMSNGIIALPGEGGGGGYSPSAPSGGGMATNRGNTAMQTYGTPDKSMTPVFVGMFNTPATETQKVVKASPFGFLMGDLDKKQPVAQTPIQLLAAFDQFGRKDYLRFRNLLIASGLASETTDAAGVREMYQSLIYDVIDMQKAGVRITPMGLIKNLAKKNGFNPAKIGADEDFAAAAGPEALKPSMQKQISVYDLDPADARTTLEQAVQAKLGRAPTKEELEDFIAAAQTRAEEDPTVTTSRFIPGEARRGGPGNTVVQREGGEVIGTTVTRTNNGFDANDVADMAVKHAERAPDYASYQAVSTYFPAFIQALGSTI